MEQTIVGPEQINIGLEQTIIGVEQIIIGVEQIIIGVEQITLDESGFFCTFPLTAIILFTVQFSGFNMLQPVVLFFK